MLKRVLILSASAGAGHLRAAQAVEKAFLELKAAEEVRNIDTLEYTNPVFHQLYSKAYIEIVNKAPDLFGWFSLSAVYWSSPNLEPSILHL